LKQRSLVGQRLPLPKKERRIRDRNLLKEALCELLAADASYVLCNQVDLLSFDALLCSVQMACEESGGHAASSLKEAEVDELVGFAVSTSVTLPPETGRTFLGRFWGAASVHEATAVHRSVEFFSFFQASLEFLDPAWTMQIQLKFGCRILDAAAVCFLHFPFKEISTLLALNAFLNS
jgi:hypothetical protein